MNILLWPATPLGPLWAPLDSENKLTSLQWGEAPAGCTVIKNHPAQTVLEGYFKGQSVKGLAQHVTLQGTPFQQKVWQALMQIPYGKTVTYGHLAEKLATSPRAIGGAVGANPVPILIPCHRVMGQNGAMTGFSAPGGLTTKRWLLKHEGVPC